jgi:IS30 family transposase
MEPKYCSSKKKKYQHLNERERCKIEALLEGKKKVCEIAVILQRDVTTIYREIGRGTISRMQTDLSEKEQYRANVGQADYVRQGKNKERSLKIGKDKYLEEYIREKLIKDRFSPDAIIGEIKTLGLEFKGMICTKTLYNYIDAEIFSGISNENLWEKRKRKKRKYKAIARRVSCKNRLARSIEERPNKINNRVEYGHWEGDSVKGPQKTKASLFTLTERKTREQVIIKVNQATQEAVKKAIDNLEVKYKDKFKIIFKSITFDNGVEFLGWKSLEISALKLTEQRTVIYFAHPYSSWERGTNENHNRMIRRFIPKGMDIADVSNEEIERIEHWMNNYPRKILGYKTPEQMRQEYFQNNGNNGLKLKSVAL